MRIRTEKDATVLEAGGESYKALSPGVFEVPDAIGQALVRFPSYSEDDGDGEPAAVAVTEEEAPKPKPRRPRQKAKPAGTEAPAKPEEDD